MFEDFLQALRLKHLYGNHDNPISQMVNDPSPAQSIMSPTMGPSGGTKLQSSGDNIQVSPPNPQDFGGQINPSFARPMPNQDQGYTPEHDASDRFNRMIDSYPQENKPGIGRKIAAAGLGTLAGIGGGDVQGTMERTLHPGFKDSVERWKDQIGPVQSAANLEKGNNSQERMFAQSVKSAEQRDKSIEETNRKNVSNADLRQQGLEETNRKNVENEKIRTSRNSIMQHHYENPDAKYDFSGPNVLMTDKYGIHDTGVPSGHMSDMDKLTLGQTNEMARISARNAGASALEDKKQTNRVGMAGINFGHAKDLKVAPSSTVARPQSEADKKTGVYNRAAQLANTKPSLKDFIHLDVLGPGTVDIDPFQEPNRWGFGGSSITKSEYDEIAKSIYGDTTDKYGVPSDTPIKKVVSPNTSPKIGPPPGFGTNNSGIVKVGNDYIRTYPNGNKAKWDGTGWEQIIKK
jgi:hypothetical protein